MPVHYPSDFSLDKANSKYYTYWAFFRSKLKLWDKRIRSEKAVIVEPDVEFRLTDLGIDTNVEPENLPLARLSNSSPVD